MAVSLVRAAARLGALKAPALSVACWASLSTVVVRWMSGSRSKSEPVKVEHVVADPLGPDDDVDSDDEDMVPMIDPVTGEWGGPTKGGTAPEPTRFGDWERAGRCTDFS